MTFPANPFRVTLEPPKKEVVPPPIFATAKISEMVISGRMCPMRFALQTAQSTVMHGLSEIRPGKRISSAMTKEIKAAILPYIKQQKRSIADIALHTGYGQSTVRRYLNGKIAL